VKLWNKWKGHGKKRFILTGITSRNLLGGGEWGKPRIYQAKSRTGHLRTIREEPNSSVTWDDTFHGTTEIPRLKDGTSQRIRIGIPRLQDCTTQKTKHEFLGCTYHRRNMNSSVTRRCFPEDNNMNSLTGITFDKTEVTLGWSHSNWPHDTTFIDSLISFGEEPRRTTNHCRYLHRIVTLRTPSKDVAKINRTYDGNRNRYIDLTWQLRST
jgi:hypothetical protein